jgi:hypothetical protein
LHLHCQWRKGCVGRHSPKTSFTNDITLPTAPNESEGENHPISQIKSLEHWPYINNDVVFGSLDIKTVREYCGIIQMSAELFHLVHSPNAKAKDRPTHVHLSNTFDEYIRPVEN